MCVLQDLTATPFTKFELSTDRFMHLVEMLKLENTSYDIISLPCLQYTKLIDEIACFKHFVQEICNKSSICSYKLSLCLLFYWGRHPPPLLWVTLSPSPVGDPYSATIKPFSVEQSGLAKSPALRRGATRHLCRTNKSLE